MDEDGGGGDDGGGWKTWTAVGVAVVAVVAALGFGGGGGGGANNPNYATRAFNAIKNFLENIWTTVRDWFQDHVLPHLVYIWQCIILAINLFLTYVGPIFLFVIMCLRAASTWLTRNIRKIFYILLITGCIIPAVNHFGYPEIEVVKTEDGSSAKILSSGTAVKFYKYEKYFEGVVNPYFKEIFHGSDLYPRKNLVLIFHGFQSDYKNGPGPILSKALQYRYEHKQQTVNIVVVDWSYYSKKWWINVLGYNQVIQKIPLVAMRVAGFIQEVLDEEKVDPYEIMLMGHSLGAHLSGFVGKILQFNGHMVDRIIGMDPAGPKFEYRSKENRLDAGDARFVLTIRTSCVGYPLISHMFQGAFPLGMYSTIGNLDVYVNGCACQPGCMDETWFNDTFFPLRICSLPCAHNFSYKLIAELIGNVKSSLYGYDCLNVEDAINGKCGPNQYTDQLFGDFSKLAILSRPPFFSAHFRILEVSTGKSFPYCDGSTIPYT